MSLIKDFPNILNIKDNEKYYYDREIKRMKDGVVNKDYFYGILFRTIKNGKFSIKFHNYLTSCNNWFLNSFVQNNPYLGIIIILYNNGHIEKNGTSFNVLINKNNILNMLSNESLYTMIKKIYINKIFEYYGSTREDMIYFIECYSFIFNNISLLEKSSVVQSVLKYNQTLSGVEDLNTEMNLYDILLMELSVMSNQSNLYRYILSIFHGAIYFIDDENNFKDDMIQLDNYPVIMSILYIFNPIKIHKINIYNDSLKFFLYPTDNKLNKYTLTHLKVGSNYLSSVINNKTLWTNAVIDTFLKISAKHGNDKFIEIVLSNTKIINYLINLVDKEKLYDYFSYDDLITYYIIYYYINNIEDEINKEKNGEKHDYINKLFPLTILLVQSNLTIKQYHKFFKFFKYKYTNTLDFETYYSPYFYHLFNELIKKHTYSDVKSIIYLYFTDDVFGKIYNQNRMVNHPVVEHLNAYDHCYINYLFMSEDEELCNYFMNNNNFDIENIIDHFKYIDITEFTYTKSIFMKMLFNNNDLSTRILNRLYQENIPSDDWMIIFYFILEYDEFIIDDIDKFYKNYVKCVVLYSSDNHIEYLSYLNVDKLKDFDYKKYFSNDYESCTLNSCLNIASRYLCGINENKYYENDFEPPMFNYFVINN